MGCKSSKMKQPAAAATPQHAWQPGETKTADVKVTNVQSPVGRANNGEAVETASKGTPPSRPGGPAGSESRRAAGRQDVDENGNPVVLPAGDWVRTEGTPFYYSEKENLYFHPPSCQFYDPTNEMWYDPEKDEWYCDDENASTEQRAVGA